MSIRNVLFIMADQWRADHFGAAGHPFLRTPHIDALAARGVRFTRAYVQSGVCGPSRMSFYTGRYMASHGATWNRVPLSAAELTLGDYLRAAGRNLTLAGKTHVMPDTRGLARFGLDGADDESELAALIRSGGFVEADRHDGHHAEPRSRYADWLRAQGYASDDPWTDYVIAAQAADGRIVSGWNMRHARLPARVRDEHSESAYTTDRAIEFIDKQGETPWALHLSYVKPHWPYIAPAPWHARYDEQSIVPAVRSEFERIDAHPVVAAYRRVHEESVNFARDEVWRTVRPTYQGLIAQLDHHLGRLWQALERSGRWQDTLVVLTADHGDLLGDHWLGEKEIFYEPVVNVPMLVHDPSPDADATRGGVDDRFVEAIDVVPTVLDALGLPPQSHRVEGRSLLDATRGARAERWRDAVFSELDYGFRQARLELGRAPDECHAWMVRTARWKYVDWQGLRPQLFDLQDDPQELRDLGAAPALEPVRREMRDRLWEWLSTRKRRTTVTLAEVEAKTATYKKAGVFYGVW